MGTSFIYQDDRNALCRKRAYIELVRFCSFWRILASFVCRFLVHIVRRLVVRFVGRRHGG